MRLTRSATREKWIKIVEEWNSSGKTAWRWSKENKVSYIQLLDWKKKLLGKSLEHQAVFVELKETVSEEVQIQWKGVTISLTGVDQLAKLRQLLKHLSC